MPVDECVSVIVDVLTRKDMVQLARNAAIGICFVLLDVLHRPLGHDWQLWRTGTDVDDLMDLVDGIWLEASSWMPVQDECWIGCAHQCNQPSRAGSTDVRSSSLSLWVFGCLLVDVSLVSVFNLCWRRLFEEASHS